MFQYFFSCRLNDVIQSDGRLYLVFEFVDKDLKKYFEACGDKALSPDLIKVIHNSRFALPKLTVGFAVVCFAALEGD